MSYPYDRTSNPIGTGHLTAEEIDRSFGPAAQGIGQEIIDACQEIRLSDDRTINHDLAAGGIHLETGGGTSKIFLDKNNPGGIGAENDDPYNKAITFPTRRDGVRAYIAGLCTYNDEQPTELVRSLDPRFAIRQQHGYVGIVQREDKALYEYEQRYAWSKPEVYAATPIEQRYGAKLARRTNDIYVRAGRTTVGTPYDSIIPGMVDLRAELKRNPNGGPNRRRNLDAVRGLVVHFNGPDVGTDDRQHIINVAAYHCTKDFSRAGDGSAIGDGIMYHVGVADDGTIYLQRDIEDVLWHCGDTEWNERSLSVYVPIGISQRATDAQKAALTRVVDSWRRYTEDGRDLVKGHQELSPTNCPGSLMADFVLPYRAAGDVVTPAPAEDVPGAQPDPWRFDNPFGKEFWVLHPFVDWIHTHGGFMATGYVRDGAFIEDGVLVQYFQRYRLEWHPGNPPENRVLGALLGQAEYDRRYPQGRPA